MFGRYSAGAIKGISAKRTSQTVGLIKKSGGKVNAIYAILGKYDVVIIADFPGVEQVFKASVALSKLTGIGFTSAPAITAEQFDRLISGS